MIRCIPFGIDCGFCLSSFGSPINNAEYHYSSYGLAFCMYSLRVCGLVGVTFLCRIVPCLVNHLSVDSAFLVSVFPRWLFGAFERDVVFSLVVLLVVGISLEEEFLGLFTSTVF